MPLPKWEQQVSAVVDKFLRRSSILARACPASGASALGMILTSPLHSLQVSRRHLQFTLHLGNLMVAGFAIIRERLLLYCEVQQTGVKPAYCQSSFKCGTVSYSVEC